MSYFDENQDYIIYGPKYHCDLDYDYEKEQKLKLEREAKERPRALKNKVWAYWKSGKNINSLNISQLKSAIKTCIENPNNPRYEGFLPLLEEELDRKLKK